jgi:translation elongation factor EF-Tu-like GTPase
MTGPADGAGQAGAWMEVGDVFHITGRGIVVTGQLRGDVPLNVGDTMVCDGGHWEVSGIEQFRKTLTTAEPGANIGVLLKKGPPGDALRERVVAFEPGSPPAKKGFWRR